MFSWLWRRGLKHSYLDKVVERLLEAKADASLEDKQFCLSEKEMVKLCHAARDVLLQEPALLELGRFEGETILVGDLHGQFQDLQNIFRELGRPARDRQFIFLGDYVDRGECGLEIVACLLAMKLRHPDRIFLLRGNHECTEITVMFGFCMECQRRSTLTVWEGVMQAFDALPLAAVLQRQVLCVHGGISPQLGSLAEINSIPRPTDVNPSGAGLLVDLLWSDPCTHTGGWCHSPRGVSFNFGLAAAREFMARTGVRSIVRAHMMQAQGFEVLGNHEVITVFSAVNYRNSGNTGAVLVLDPDLQMHFRTFLPPPRPAQQESPPASSPASVLPEAAAAAEGDGMAPAQQPAAAEGDSTAEAQQQPSSGPPEPLGPCSGGLASSSGKAEGEPGGGGGGSPRGPSLARTSGSSVEQVALEEVEEDSRVVRQLEAEGTAGLAKTGVGGLGAGAAATSGEDSEWRYALPPTALGGGVAGRPAGGT